MTIIIKDVQFNLTAAAASNTRLTLQDPSGTTVYLINQSVAAGALLHYAVWMVLTPGQFMASQSDAGAYTVWVSGSILQGVPPPLALFDTLQPLPA